MNNIYFFQHFFLILTIVLSLVAFYNKDAMEFMILNVAKLNKGKYQGLFFSGFIHANYVHLLFNMITYYAFAYTWANIYNSYFGLAWWLFGVFYLSSIFVVNVVVWVANYDRLSYRSLGSSGGVSALVFSCIILFPWDRLYIFFLPLPAVVFALLYLGYSIYRSVRKSDRDVINHLAHVAGGIYGVLFSFIIEPNVWSIFLNELAKIPFSF